MPRLPAPFSNVSHNRVSLLALGLLIFLRIPFLAGLTTFWPQTQTWAYIIFIIATYLLTAFLIWWERPRLHDFWIDVSSAIIFLCQLPLGLFGLGLFAAMVRGKARFPSPPSHLLRWTLLGALLAILASIFMAQTHLYPPLARTAGPADLTFLFGAMLTQMTNAAVFEEPLFRGFLWGYLRLAGWKNGWIWLFQALLFTLAHFYYLATEPFISYFIRLMIPAMLLGLIAWRARSITASMVTHGFLNATGDLLMHSGTLLRALSLAWAGAGLIAALLILGIGLDWLQSRRPAHPGAVT